MARMPGQSLLKKLFGIVNKKNGPVKTQRVIVEHTMENDQKRSSRYKNDSSASQMSNQPAISKKNNSHVKSDAALTRTGAAEKSKKMKHVFKLKQRPQGTEVLPAEKRHEDAEHPRRFSDKKRKAIMNPLNFLFERKKIRSTSNGAALEFAESRKRLGKKGKRKRQIIIYAGTSLVLIVVLLAVVLVPGGAAAQSDPSQTAEQGSAEKLAQDAVALYEGQQAIDASMNVETTEVTQSPTQTSIATTPPDENPTATPSEKPTTKPTTEPTTEPTVEPTTEPTVVPTTQPDVTPNPINIDEWVTYYKVEADLYYNEVGYSSNHYNYNDNEKYMLAQIIQSESGGETYKGKVAVGNVVMNRVLCRSYPGSTIAEVLTAPNQFAYNSNVKPSSAAMTAASEILDYELWVIPQNIYFFRATSSTDNWGSHAYSLSIGAHAFYSERYSGRGSGIPPALFKRTYKWAQYGCAPENRVYRIQFMLNKLGYDVYADKYFGLGTKEALIEFQEREGLQADGVAGPSTVEALIDAFGPEEYYLKFCV